MEGLAALLGLSHPARGAHAHDTRAEATAGDARHRWLLAVVLAVQAGLSLRLIWLNTAFQDEALYLWSGHVLLAHQAPVSSFATYFSGAPVIYPVIGALANRVGGLVAARLLSLTFMLAATALLHGVTRRLSGRRTAAFFAAALFAGTGSAQFLGAFATYDAMAVMLLALATWLGVRAVPCRLSARLALLVSGGLVLALADATAYTAALYDPVVASVVALAVWRSRRFRDGLAAGVAMTAVTLAALGIAYKAGGPAYAQGIGFSVLHRFLGSNPPLQVLRVSADWVGILAILALAGAVLVTVKGRRLPEALMAWVLAIAVLLAPAGQARLHTTVSLFKHVGYGAWFASVIAGWLLASLPQMLSARWRRRTLAAGVLAAVAICIGGLLAAAYQYDGWPNAARMVAAVKGYEQPGGTYVVEDSPVVAYYLDASILPGQMWNTWYFGYTDPVTHKYLANGPAYADAIKHGAITEIVLAFGDTYATDQVIMADIHRYRTYRLAAVIPYVTAAGSNHYEIWVPLPQGKSKPGQNSHR